MKVMRMHWVRLTSFRCLKVFAWWLVLKPWRSTRTARRLVGLLVVTGQSEPSLSCEETGSSTGTEVEIDV